MALTIEQSEWFTKMELLFGTDGWKTFMDDVQGFLDATKASALGRPNWDGVVFDKGRIAAFEQMLSYEGTCARLKAEMEGADAESV